MNPWSHLTNALLIDWVLESLKTRTDTWALAWGTTLNATRPETRIAARYETLNADLDENLRATLDAATTAARRSAWDAATDVILALVAYDDCDQYLNMSYEQLLTYAMLSERPQAVLLLPLKWVQEHEQVVTPA